jgi:1-phosphofructokinase family hexose kinase
MVLTVTLNPAVDYVVFGGGFAVGATNRGEDIAPDPGGKGNNAARIARALGAEVDATGIVGGFTGRFITESLEAEGLGSKFYRAPSPTRITASFIDVASLEQTKIVPFGPAARPEEITGFRSHLSRLLDARKYSMVSMNGSLARGMEAEEYSLLIGLCSERGVPVVLDTSGRALEAAVAPASRGSGPFMIKPNIDEARALLGAGKSVGAEALAELLRPLLETIPCIALTLAEEGAMLLTREGCLRGSIPGVAAVNPVCAGDAFVGGFLARWDSDPGNFEACFRYALAAGSATASVEGLMWERSLFDGLLERVRIRSAR